MCEYCESMMKKEELDQQFLGDDAVILPITILSHEPFYFSNCEGSMFICRHLR